jgi:hypothetical protein
MLTQKGELTDIGSWYMGGAATNNIPESSATTSSVSGTFALSIVAAMWFALA